MNEYPGEIRSYGGFTNRMLLSTSAAAATIETGPSMSYADSGQEA
jgi:hypothetical protein